MEFEYFEQEWEDKPDWTARAKSETKRLWERDYKGSTVGPAPGASPGARENDLHHGIGSVSTRTDLPHGPAVLAVFLLSIADLHSRRDGVAEEKTRPPDQIPSGLPGKVSAGNSWKDAGLLG
jgi:hypothetical protein